MDTVEGTVPRISTNPMRTHVVQSITTRHMVFTLSAQLITIPVQQR